ncbi:MAG: response regulator [Leptospiraceae bacterium]|nr:response regulator [Leptospiraceae bacterium]
MKTFWKQPAWLAAGVLLFSLSIGEYTHSLYQSNELQKQNTDVVLDAARLRSRIEAILNANLYLTDGLAAYIIAYQGRVNPQYASRMLQMIYQKGTCIRNVGLAPDNRIALIYPRQGNEAAIGLEYKKIPAQWQDVKRAILTRKPVIAGPIKMVQGGWGLIKRIPVFLDNGRYWGLISIVVDIDQLMGAIEESEDQDRIQYAMRIGGRIIKGQGSLFNQQHYDATAVLAGYEIEIAVVPAQKSVLQQHYDTILRLLLWLLAVLVTALTYFQLHNNAKEHQINQQLRREKQKAESANQAKGRFLANMSHEIRTPLNAIAGYSDLLDQTNLNSNQKELINSIQTAGRVLTDTISDVLDFASIENEVLRLNLQAISLTQLVKDIEIVTSPAARQKNLQITYNLDLGLQSLEIQTDESLLKQILINLISNAIKFTKQGEVRLDITSLQQTGNQVRLQFTVSDTGPGIDMAHTDKVFTPFFQIQDAANREHEGSGLGLAICQRFTQALGGNLELESQVGQGSRFSFSLQFACNQIQEQPAKAKEPTNSADALQNVQILLIEDNHVNRMLARRMLEKSGAVIIEAEHGIQALNWLEQPDSACDLILMDVHMPEMDGITATQKIRANPRWTAVPILALTANVSTDTVAACLAAGMNGFISKPVRWQVMIKRIVDLLTQPVISHTDPGDELTPRL